MSKLKKINPSGILIAGIFVAAVIGLSTINQWQHVESFSETDTIKKNSFLDSQDEVVRKFVEVDTTLMSFFDDLRKELGLVNNHKI